MELLPLISSTSVLYIPMILDTCTTVVYGVWLPFFYIPNKGTPIMMTVFFFFFPYRTHSTVLHTVSYPV